MRLSLLRELAEEARQHPHYQLRDQSEQEFTSAARRSFNRLTPEQKQLVQKSWMTALKEAKEEPNQVNAIEFIRFRFLAQTNLFFLCNLLEKYRNVTLKTHEDICNQFFVQKNPSYISFEQFANQYTDLKDRMLLVPRGGFKSSIDIADCVQWIISFPEVTILILTGVYQLASDFLGELRAHFTLEENGVSDAKGKSGFGPRKVMDKITGEWTASMFQVLFPEHCIPTDDGKQFEFQSPVGGDAREPTVRAASIEQALSGMHFDVLKLDDVVTNENSLTSERLQKINKQISVNRAMLHPYGFNDVIGTWYDEFDYYGITIKKEEADAAEDGLLMNVQGAVDSGVFNSSVNCKVYLRSAWWPNEAARKLGKIETELTKPDMDLWFPERLTFEFLTKEKKKDKEGFAIKYLNNPRQIHRVKFSRELLLRRTIPGNQMPTQGITVTAVDTAYSTKSWADYTVIITARIFGGRFYIINMTRGRFNEYDLPRVIAMTGFKYKPKRIAIEDSVGVKWMARELRREMDKLSISIPVEFVTLGFGSKLRSKQLKAKPVLRLLGDERLYLLNSCEGIEEIYSELEKFTGTSEDAHDDIVSAISLLCEQFGAYAAMDQKLSFTNTQYTADQQSRERHDLIYGLGKYRRFNASQMEEENPITVFQLQNGQFQEAGDIDPLSDLLG